MVRESERTLLSLTEGYQIDLKSQEYEVIIIDSGSSMPLDKKKVESKQSNFRYFYIESKDPSPCEAMNYGISVAKSDTVVCCIDGARILSPHILSLMIKAKRVFEKPFVYTLGFHIGDKVQNEAIKYGYSQAVEDILLNNLNWEKNGYRLFERSCLAGSSSQGYFGKITESNCFSIDKKTLLDLGGFDIRFNSPGGGLVNLDVFKRLHNLPDIQPVMLLGEGTFHQFHGGVATNVPREEHPFQKFETEYFSIRGKEKNPFNYSQDKRFYMGNLNKYSSPYIFKIEESN